MSLSYKPTSNKDVKLFHNIENMSLSKGKKQKLLRKTWPTEDKTNTKFFI